MSDRIRIQSNKKNKKPDKRELWAIIKKKWKLFALAFIVVILLIGSIIVLVLGKGQKQEVDLGTFKGYSIEELKESEYVNYYPDMSSEGYKILDTTGLYYGNTFHAEQQKDDSKVTTTIIKKENIDYQDNVLDETNTNKNIGSPAISADSFGEKYLPVILDLASKNQQTENYLVEFSLFDDTNYVTYTISTPNKADSEALFKNLVNIINK